MIYSCQKEKSGGQELNLMHKYVSQKRLDLPLKAVRSREALKKLAANKQGHPNLVLLTWKFSMQNNLKFYESENISYSSLHRVFESENFRFPFYYEK